MNIEKLAKHLKEFTLDEIEMIVECDCRSELDQLLNMGKVTFENQIYKYCEIEKIENFAIFIDKNYHKHQQNFEKAIKSFMTQYVDKYCKKETIRTYCSLFKINILPFFKNKDLKNITNIDIANFYQYCVERGLGARRIKNTMALLKQFLKYCKNKGWIKNYCEFQVKRLTNKNEFSINRIIFEE